MSHENSTNTILACYWCKEERAASEEMKMFPKADCYYKKSVAHETSVVIQAIVNHSHQQSHHIVISYKNIAIKKCQDYVK